MELDSSEIQYQTELLKTQYKFARSNQYTDFRIKFKNTIIDCHKSVICANSEYFRHICDGQSDATLEHSILGDDGVILEAVVKFMYLGWTDIRKTNATSLLRAAHTLKHTALKQYCVKFMIANLDIDNFDSYAQLAKQEELHVSELCTACYRFSRERFSQTIHTTWFRSLELEEVKVYLQHDDLNVECEENVIEAVERWLDYTPDDKKDAYWKELLPCIRLQYCDPSSLEKYSQNEVVDINFKLRISEYLRTGKHGEENPRDSYVAEHVSRAPAPVLPAKKRDIIIVGGTEEDGKLNERLLHYDKDDFLLATSAILTGSINYSVCRSGDILIISGGFNRQYKNSVPAVKRYSFTKRTWRKNENLLEPRDSHGSAIVANKLYVIGGKREVKGEEAKTFTSVHIFDLSAREWFEGTVMHSAVYGPGIAVVAKDILVVGGNQRLGIYTANVLKYDTKEHTWTNYKKIPCPCAPFRSTAVVEFSVFVVTGGVLYKYDVRMDKWTKVLTANLPKDCSLVSYENRVLAFGGVLPQDNGQPIATDHVYIYDKARRTWSPEERRMPVPLVHHWVMAP